MTMLLVLVKDNKTPHKMIIIVYLVKFMVLNKI